MNKEARVILKQVCSALEVSEELVMSSTRKAEVVVARLIAVSMVWEHLGDKFSLTDVGKWFYPLNYTTPHTMVIYANREVDKRKAKKEFRVKWNKCKGVVNGDMDFENIPQL